MTERETFTQETLGWVERRLWLKVIAALSGRERSVLMRPGGQLTSAETPAPGYPTFSSDFYEHTQVHTHG